MLEHPMYHAKDEEEYVYEEEGKKEPNTMEMPS